jgi:hypothetical protein
MDSRQQLFWFGTVSLVLVLAGVVFAVFGLAILPVQGSVLLRWESAIYGSIMIGWGTTLFRAGRMAFRRGDVALIRILSVGLTVWLLIEAALSAYLRVSFNVGVDVAVLALFLIPLRGAIRYRSRHPD